MDVVILTARLNLITVMIPAADTTPEAVADEARRIVYKSLPEDDRELHALASSVWTLGPLWNQYTLVHVRFFERDLITGMERFFKTVFEATRRVRAAAVDALQDPKNWSFDADLSPEHETNVEAAKANRVTYKPELRQYVDEDGCPRFDAYGQRL